MWDLSTGLLSALKYVVQEKVAPLLTFTKFFGWGEVAAASAWLLLTGLVVSTVASLITLRRYRSSRGLSPNLQEAVLDGHRR